MTPTTIATSCFLPIPHTFTFSLDGLVAGLILVVADNLIPCSGEPPAYCVGGTGDGAAYCVGGIDAGCARTGGGGGGTGVGRGAWLTCSKAVANACTLPKRWC